MGSACKTRTGAAPEAEAAPPAPADAVAAAAPPAPPAPVPEAPPLTLALAFALARRPTMTPALADAAGPAPGTCTPGACNNGDRVPNAGLSVTCTFGLVGVHCVPQCGCAGDDPNRRSAAPAPVRAFDHKQKVKACGTSGGRKDTLDGYAPDDTCTDPCSGLEKSNELLQSSSSLRHRHTTSQG